MAKKFATMEEEMDYFHWWNKHIYGPYMTIGGKYTSLQINGDEVAIRMQVEKIEEKMKVVLEKLVASGVLKSFNLKQSYKEQGWIIETDSEKYGPDISLLDLEILEK